MNHSAPPFKPTPALLEAAEQVVLARAYVRIIRPVIQGIQTRILQEKKYPVAPEFQQEKVPRYVSRDQESYLMIKKDYEEYFALCKEAYNKEGFRTEKPTQCPLGMAENWEIEAGQTLLQEAQYIHGIDPDELTYLEDRYKLEELTMKMLAPFLDHDKILKSFFGH